MATPSSWGSSAEEGRDWSSLPDPALFSIATSLAASLADVLAFARVCRAWSSLAAANENLLMASLPPFLFRDRDADLYCPADGRRYRNTRLAALLEEGEGGPVEAVGGSFGHVIVVPSTASADRRTFSVVNPLTGTLACRFPPNSRPIVRWAALSSPPASPDCAIWSSDGYFVELCRRGDQRWSTCPFQGAHLIPRPVFLHGKGYLDHQTKLAAFDTNPRTQLTILPARASPVSARFPELSLCASDSELLLISVVRYRGSGSIKKFLVYIFDFSVADWVRLHSLGDRALFCVCDVFGAALSVRTPGSWGGCGSCIYFADLRDDELGVFHLPDGKIECLVRGYPSEPMLSGQSPVWILPSMCY